MGKMKNLVTDLSFDELKAELATEFPKVWIKDGGEFDGRKNCLWTGEGSSIKLQDVGFSVPAFDTYAFHGYEAGVWQSLYDFLQIRGFFAEAYDAGTFFIYKA